MTASTLQRDRGEAILRRISRDAPGSPPPSPLARVAATAARAALAGRAAPADGELEWEVGRPPRALRDLPTRAVMEHLGHVAAEAESEAEAEAFAGALIPVAARLAPAAAPAMIAAAPQLIRGTAGIARSLRRTPATRPLVRALPAIVSSTASTLARQAARGQAPTPQQAVDALAAHANRTLADPTRCAQALRRSQALDRRYHGVAR